jgi:2-C-methyl-D-erythritol 4-phosphate cytidylyltransferase
MGLSVAAVVLGAGSGRRLSGTNKALLALAGEPMIAHSLRALRGLPSISQIIVVMNPHDQERLQAEWHVSPQDLGADVVVPGGSERWLSSQAGCQASTPPPQVADADSLLLVHDAARPMVQASDIQAVVAAAQESGAALLAEPVADTLKSSGQDSHVLDTVSRDCLWRAQTPQVARRDWLLEAFAHWAENRQDNPTDESMLLEYCGHSPRLVASSAPNFKVTTQRDLQLAEALLRTTLAAKSSSS